MTRQEIVNAIAALESRLQSWRADDQVAMWECEQLACNISALYDELAVLDSVQLMLDNPEDYYDNE
jgi:hypothetical protein